MITAKLRPVYEYEFLQIFKNIFSMTSALRVSRTNI